MPSPTPGAKALDKALSRLKDPKGQSRKQARQALEELKKRHAILHACFESRAQESEAVTTKARRDSVAVAEEHVRSCKKYLETVKRGNGHPAFVQNAESGLAVAEALYRSVVAVSAMTGSVIAKGNDFEIQLWSWFDQLTEVVATALIDGKIADVAVVSASGTLIVLGVAGGPTTVLLAAAASGILLAADLMARLRKSKDAGTDEARLEAATVLIKAVTNVADNWLATLEAGP